MQRTDTSSNRVPAPMLLAIALVGALAGTLTGPARADTRAGYDLWNRGEYDAAVAQWRPAAIAGDAEAQYNLGQAYKLGRGVPTDLKIAESWFGKAAAHGNQPARDNYGLMLFQNGDRQAAMPYIEEAAGRGEPRAQYVLGTALFNGDLVRKDWVRAYALMTRASASGIAAASASLAQMDKYIPLDQRQRGLVAARALDATAQAQAVNPQTPSLNATEAPAPAPVRAARTASPTRVAQATDLAAAPAPTPAKLAAPRPATKRPPPVERDIRLVNERPVTARRAPAIVAVLQPAAPSARWRVQLGAFSDGARVQAQWQTLRSRIPALSGYQLIAVAAGPVTRLQAGPLANRATADALCVKVKAGGSPCLPIAP